MGYIGNGAHGAIVYRGMGYRGYRPHGQWGTWDNSIQGVWGIGCMGNGAHRVMIAGVMGHMGYGVQGMGHMGNGVQGYGIHEQWGTGVWGTWAMGHRGAMVYRGIGHMGNGA